MTKVNVGLDVGGTNIKGLCFEAGVAFTASDLQIFAAQADGTATEIVQNFSNIIQQLVPDRAQLAAVLMAFPGPFDYVHGISWMQGLNKFDQLYGLNFSQLLLAALQQSDLCLASDFRLYFENDATAFGFGEYARSEIQPNKGLYLTLGTGCGSTLIEAGQQVKQQYGVPASGMLFNLPFHDQTIDAYLSARGLARIVQTHFSEPPTLISVAKLAAAGDQQALDCFTEFGQNLGQALAPFLRDFAPDQVVLGGQISQSFQFMQKGFTQQTNFPLTRITVAQNTSISALRGLNWLQQKGELKR